ncbi:MAG: agmatine deiminase family protein [Gemmataceae bacterium]|nr:agmatine deiminase family protein [Gemmataceae bacterium]
MEKMKEDLGSLGYRLPAEWGTHASTWLSWPHQEEDWPGKFEPIPWVYCEIIRYLTSGEIVRLVTQNAQEKEKILALFKKTGINSERVGFILAPTDRSWIRDFGPVFIKDNHGNKGIVDFVFNGWAKYDNWNQDNAIPNFVASRLNYSTWKPVHNGCPVVLEGGSIDVDGEGTLITTEECLQSRIQERNPGFTKKDYEEVFSRYFGITKVLWLGQGIAGDDTHGHVDDLTRFVAPGRVVTMVESNKSDPNYEPLRENHQRLAGMSDSRGKKLEVIKLPMPGPVEFAGQRLPASYANFYIANQVVLAPTFNDPNDRVALNTLEELFPGRQVVGIHALDLLWGLGTLHCLSQQEPL